MKKSIIILILLVILAGLFVACSSYIVEETTIWTDFIETYLPTLLPTTAPTAEYTTQPTVLTEPPETEPIVFGSDITFSYEYVSDGSTMPYVLYTPSKAEAGEPIPLLVWLHGSGEVGISSAGFCNRGLPKILNEWTLDGFNMYVLCPHLVGNWNTDKWNNSDARENMRELLDKVLAENNIDPTRVIISGCSLGGFGATYMAWALPDYFSKLVVVSGYQCQVKLEEIHIPAICFAGTVEKGEQSACVDFMKRDFAKAFGKENTFSIETSHANVPTVIFNEDKDGNNRSDLIEWMLEN